MAARLMKRCTYLLKEFSRLAPPVSPAGPLRLVGVAHKALTTSVTLTSSNFPGSLSEPVEKQPMFTPYPERQEVDQLIEKATRPEEILDLLGAGHCLHQNHAALMLIQISRLLSEKPEGKATLCQDTRFQQLLQLANSQVGPSGHVLEAGGSLELELNDLFRSSNSTGKRDSRVFVALIVKLVSA